MSNFRPRQIVRKAANGTWRAIKIVLFVIFLLILGWFANEERVSESYHTAPSTGGTMLR